MPRKGGAPENLVDWNTVDPEVKSEWGRRGAMKGAETKRQKKLLKEVLTTLMELPLEEGEHIELDDVEAISQLKNKNINYQIVIAFKLLEKASKGNVKAFEAIRDTIGEKPADNVNLTHIEPVVIVNDLQADEEK